MKKLLLKIMELKVTWCLIFFCPPCGESYYSRIVLGYQGQEQGQRHRQGNGWGGVAPSPPYPPFPYTYLLPSSPLAPRSGGGRGGQKQRQRTRNGDGKGQGPVQGPGQRQGKRQPTPPPPKPHRRILIIYILSPQTGTKGRSKAYWSSRVRFHLKPHCSLLCWGVNPSLPIFHLKPGMDMRHPRHKTGQAHTVQKR